MNRPVLVSGLGAVTPLGKDVASTWRELIAGHDAAAPLTLFSTAGCRAHTAASAILPDLPFCSAKKLSRYSRASRLALPAALEALAMAGLVDPQNRCLLPDLPIAVSTTAGGMSFGEDFFKQVLARKRGHLLGHVARYLPQQQTLDLQEILQIGGSTVILANACASGANAIGHAADMIAAGAADCVLAGGFEALNELVFIGFDCLQATTVEKCRPFDLNRSGLMIGEGAAFLVLESREHLAARRGTALCRLSGYGHTTDFFHLTQPEPEGAALIEVMHTAAREAGIAAEEIGYVNAHGTATVINDNAEARAFAGFFNGSLPSARISSTKAAIGHTLGAAGAIEALFTVQALQTGYLPPQLNLQDPIPELKDALVKPGETQPLRHAMSVNLGFGGSNAALIFSRDEN